MVTQWEKLGHVHGHAVAHSALWWGSPFWLAGGERGVSI